MEKIIILWLLLLILKWGEIYSESHFMAHQFEKHFLRLNVKPMTSIHAAIRGWISLELSKNWSSFLNLVFSKNSKALQVILHISRMLSFNLSASIFLLVSVEWKRETARFSVLHTAFSSFQHVKNSPFWCFSIQW